MCPFNYSRLPNLTSTWLWDAFNIFLTSGLQDYQVKLHCFIDVSDVSYFDTLGPGEASKDLPQDREATGLDTGHPAGCRLKMLEVF